MQDIFYLHSAADLAWLSLREERAYDRRVPDRHRACVVGAVTCSVSFLECAVNGLFEESVRALKPTRFQKALGAVWAESFDRQPILTKFQLALALGQRTLFEANTEPYQSVDALIALRNAIAHPKELIASTKQQDRLEGRLRGRFRFTTGATGDSEFFPQRCLSPGCAAWAVLSAANFALAFYQRLPTKSLPVIASSLVQRIVNEAEQVRREDSQTRQAEPQNR